MTEILTKFENLPKNEFLTIRDRDGKSYTEFFIDGEVDKVIMNTVKHKGGKEVTISVSFDAAHVYDIYRLLGNYLTTPTMEE